MAGEGFGLSLLEFFGRQVLLARGDRPKETERVAHVPVTVAPELIGDGHEHLAAGRDSLVPNGVGIGYVEVKNERQAALGQRRRR